MEDWLHTCVPRNQIACHGNTTFIPKCQLRLKPSLSYRHVGNSFDAVDCDKRKLTKPLLFLLEIEHVKYCQVTLCEFMWLSVLQFSC